MQFQGQLERLNGIVSAVRIEIVCNSYCFVISHYFGNIFGQTNKGVINNPEDTDKFNNWNINTSKAKLVKVK